MVPVALPDDMLRFITEHVDSVPHLEALLLVWETAPRRWTTEEIARRVYLPRDRAERLLQDLVDKGWLTALSDAFAFRDGAADTAMIARLAGHYRSHLVEVADAIHRKAPTAVLDFARAFDLRKER